MGFSDYEKAGVLLCELVCNSFGLLGVVLVVVLIIGYPNLRIFAFKLVMFLSISTAGYSVGVLIGPSDTFSCQLQAVFISYFSVSSVLWLLMISHSMHRAVIYQSNPEILLKKYMIIGYIGPLPTSLVPVFTSSYSRTSLGMCWIDTTTQGGQALIIIQIWLLLLGVLVYTSVTLVRVHREAKRMRREPNESHLEVLKLFSRLKHFSIIIYLAWAFAFMNILALIVDPSAPSFGLTILHVLFNGIQGIFILCAFVKDHAVYEALVDTFRTCLPCFIRKNKNKRKLEIPARM